MFSDIFKGLGSFWMLAMLALILLPSRYLVYLQDGRKKKGKNVKGTYPSKSQLQMRKKILPWGILPNLIGTWPSSSTRETEKVLFSRYFGFLILSTLETDCDTENCMQKVYSGVILGDKPAKKWERQDWIEGEASLKCGCKWDFIWSFVGSETQMALRIVTNWAQGGLCITCPGCYCECLQGRGITLGKVVPYSQRQFIMRANSTYSCGRWVHPFWRRDLARATQHPLE